MAWRGLAGDEAAFGAARDLSDAAAAARRHEWPTASPAIARTVTAYTMGLILIMFFLSRWNQQKLLLPKQEK
jgi:hypothetical protein